MHVDGPRLPICERRDWPHTAHRRPLSAVPPSTLLRTRPGRERQRDDADGRFRGLELQARMDKAEVNQWREGVEEKAKRKSVKANPAKGTGRVDGWETGGASEAERAAV